MKAETNALDLLADLLDGSDATDAQVDSISAALGEPKSRILGLLAAHERLSRLGEFNLDLQTRAQAIPDSVGRYHLLRALDDPGSPSVFVARDPLLGREVVIKLPHPGRRGRPDAHVVEEARALAKLKHPGVVLVHDVADGQFLVMEYLGGRSLADVIAEQRRQANGAESEDEELARLARSLTSPEAKAKCLEAIADALAHCHEQGVVHRDVKPANVMLAEDAGTVQPCLVDLGLAHFEERERVEGQLIGTAAYLAPEQVADGSTGARPASDQYSFGMLACELLTGTNPHQKESQLETVSAVANEPIQELPGVPSELEAVVLRCLAHHPTERYDELAQVRDDLEAFRKRHPVSALPPSTPRAAALWMRRNGRLVATALVGVALLLLLGAYGEHKRVWATVRSADGIPADRPADLELQASALHRAWAGAQIFEAGPLGWLVPGSLQTRAEDVIRGWMVRSRDLHSERGGTANEEEWIAFFRVEHLLFGELLPAYEIGRRGLVEYIERQGITRLFRQTTLHEILSPPSGYGWLHGAHAWWETPMDATLPPGAYRLMTWDASGRELLGEIAFTHHGADEPARRLVSLPDALEDAVHVPSEPIPIGAPDAAAVPSQRVPMTFPSETPERRQTVAQRVLPGYRIGPRITWRQAVDFGDLTGHTITIPAGSDPDAPAKVSMRFARTYAAAKGARLPTALEVAHALRLADNGQLTGISPVGEQGAIEGEWVADLIHRADEDSDDYYLVYQFLKERHWGTEIQWLRSPSGAPIPEGGADRSDADQAFRLARTAATVDEFRSAQTAEL
ncbi:MAG: serine/threonine-protein kinase [Planctomycetota bacterium]